MRTIFLILVLLNSIISKSHEKEAIDPAIQLTIVKKNERQPTNPERFCFAQDFNLKLMRIQNVKSVQILDNQFKYYLTMTLDTFGRVIESITCYISYPRVDVYRFYYSDTKTTSPSIIIFKDSLSNTLDTIPVDTNIQENRQPLTKSKYRWSASQFLKCEYYQNGLIKESIIYHRRYLFFKHASSMRVYEYEYY